MATKYPKGYINQSMSAARILSHGEVTDLSEGFSLKGEVPFSILILPAAAIDNTEVETPEKFAVLLNCELYLDKSESPLPVILGQWSEAAMLRIAPDALNLTDYRLFWGAGGEDL